MLRRLVLGDWKSFGSGHAARNNLGLGPLTLLVGPNASGKSNVLDSLRFLQGAALGLPIYEVLRGRWEGGREVWPGIRGGDSGAALQGRDAFQVVSCWAWGGWGEVTFALTVSTSEEPFVLAEALSRGAGDDVEILYHTDNHRAGNRDGDPLATIGTDVVNESPRGVDARRFATSRILLGQLDKERETRSRPDSRSETTVDQYVRAIRGALREVIFYDLDPDLMRKSSPHGAPSMGLGGENIAALLYSLSPEAQLDIVEWVGELCSPKLEGFFFEEVHSTREVVFGFREQSGRRISARSASDGTLRFLGIVTGLLTAPPGSLLVFEEPDIGLHSARIHLLAELLEQVTRERHVQVIATTHSPVLLAHLSSQALESVIAFDRDLETGNTVCSRVGDLPQFPTLAKSRERDHLISTGWLERAL